MVDARIVRKATPEEKRDFHEVGAVDVSTAFRKILVAHEKKYNKLHIPFCRVCAKFDFEDRLQNFLREQSRGRGTGFNQTEQLDVLKDLQVDDLSEYADPSRYKLLSEKEAMEDKLMDGMRRKVKTGMFLNFQCQVRGCGHSVFVPLDEYDQRKKKRKSEA